MITDNITDLTGNTGTRFLGSLLTAELVSVVTDMRWMLLLVVILVVADFHFGRAENSKRWHECKRNGDVLMASQYAWRTSRAIRRTINKTVDYLIWIIVGMAVGMAVLEPVGVEHELGGVFATSVIVFCECKSLFGHFFYLHGVIMEKKTLRCFVRAVIVAIVKKRNPDLGDAVKEGFERADEEKTDSNNEKQ